LIRSTSHLSQKKSVLFSSIGNCQREQQKSCLTHHDGAGPEDDQQLAGREPQHLGPGLAAAATEGRRERTAAAGEGAAAGGPTGSAEVGTPGARSWLEADLAQRVADGGARERRGAAEGPRRVGRAPLNHAEKHIAAQTGHPA
jgi:hypothetical protein